MDENAVQTGCRVKIDVVDEWRKVTLLRTATSWAFGKEDGSGTRLEGFEPTTPGSEDRCSVPLSYRRIIKKG